MPFDFREVIPSCSLDSPPTFSLVVFDIMGLLQKDLAPKLRGPESQSQLNILGTDFMCVRALLKLKNCSLLLLSVASCLRARSVCQELNVRQEQ